MTSQRWIDPAGLFQVTALAAVGVFYWVIFYSVALSKSLALLPAILIGIALAGLIVWAQFWSWRRLGGRAAVVMTNEWIRAGDVPATVPREVSFPLLYTREVNATRDWWSLVTSGLWIALTIGQLLSDESGTNDIVWWVGLALWVGIAARTIYYNLRWLPLIRKLLRGQPFPVGSSTADSQNTYS